MALGPWSRPADQHAKRRGLGGRWYPLWLALVPSLAVAAVSLEHVDHPRWTNKYDKHFKKYAKHYFGPGMDWRWFKAQAIAESNLRPSAKNPSGATGLMQILPSTFREIRQTNPSFASLREPRWNIAAGIYYDRYLYKRWLKRTGRLDDHLDYTFASYNAGFGRISKAFRKAGGSDGAPLPWPDVAIHSPRETRHYVEKIQGLMNGAGGENRRAIDDRPAGDADEADATPVSAPEPGPASTSRLPSSGAATISVCAGLPRASTMRLKDSAVVARVSISRRSAKKRLTAEAPASAGSLASSVRRVSGLLG